MRDGTGSEVREPLVLILVRSANEGAPMLVKSKNIVFLPEWQMLASWVRGERTGSVCSG